MKAIINGFSWFINTIKMIFEMIMSVFETIAMVFRYLITIVDIAFDTIATLPPWIKAFAIITVSISIAYIIIGRNVGKSE